MVSCNWNAVRPAFLQSWDSVVEELVFSSQQLAMQVTSSSSAICTLHFVISCATSKCQMLQTTDTMSAAFTVAIYNVATKNFLDAASTMHTVLSRRLVIGHVLLGRQNWFQCQQSRHHELIKSSDREPCTLAIVSLQKEAVAMRTINCTALLMDPIVEMQNEKTYSVEGWAVCWDRPTDGQWCPAEHVTSCSCKDASHGTSSLD